jgi:para-nitrobenzyl esterase
MKRIIGYALAMCFLWAASADAQLHTNGPVKIESGLISGATTGKGGSISVYKGIPYAAPPVGKLRWRPPEPPESWEGVRDATEFGAVAPQRPRKFGGVSKKATMSEDCLYLNVWTPARSADDVLPVMVWIHGGGFRYGAGSVQLYTGTRLAEAGVVLVNFNYRLNVFGFFAHPLLTEESGHNASGNYGLMDQIAALKWVRNNIAAFGGDPDRITIFGESAGARSVSLLMASPLSEGLFHRAIAHSGALRDTTTSLAEREERGTEIAAALGCDKEADPLAALRSKTFEELIGPERLPWNPFVDGWVVPEHPESLYATGKIHNVPLIAGSNTDEATYRMVSDPIPSASEYEAFIRGLFGDAADRVLGIYPAETDDDVFDALNRFESDRRMALHARNQVRWMENVSAKAYLYHFSRVPPSILGWKLGAHHGAELRYAFGNLDFSLTDFFFARKVDKKLSAAMVSYWTQFAATGDPNGGGLPEWPAYKTETDMHIELGTTIVAGKNFRKKELDILEEIMYGSKEETHAGTNITVGSHRNSGS